MTPVWTPRSIPVPIGVISKNYFNSPVGFFQAHILETIFTDPKFGLLAILFWIWAEIPGINFVFANLNPIYVFDFSQGFMFFFQ